MDKEKKSPSRPKRKTTGKPAVFKRARPRGQAIQGIYGDSPMNRPDQILPEEIQIRNAKSGKKMKKKIFTSPKKESHVSIPFEREKILDKKRQERNAAKSSGAFVGIEDGFKTRINPTVKKRRNKTKNSLVRGKMAKEARRKS